MNEVYKTIKLFDGQILTNLIVSENKIKCPCGRNIIGFYLDQGETFDCICGNVITLEPIQYKVVIETE